MSDPFVIVVILNTNRRQDTLECLASLDLSSYKNQKIIVLDNHSTDGSCQAIQKSFPSVQIISLEKNLGYTGNNNVGIKSAMDQGADWVFVLNEDTILAPDCLAELVEAGESDKSIGIVGPMIYHYDEPTVIQSAGGMLGRYWENKHIAQNEPDQGQFSRPHVVDWISGCGILVRRAVIEQVGMLDERFFYYWEETEWCIRAGKSNWRILHVPQAKLWHKGVQRDYHPSPSVTYYNTRNRLMVLAKHHAPLIVWIFVWVLYSRTFLSWTIKPRWRGMSEHRRAMWNGIVDFLNRHWGQKLS
jgi:GT2 family glycosyltransferase